MQLLQQLTKRTQRSEAGEEDEPANLLLRLELLTRPRSSRFATLLMADTTALTFDERVQPKAPPHTRLRGPQALLEDVQALPRAREGASGSLPGARGFAC